MPHPIPAGPDHNGENQGQKGKCAAGLSVRDPGPPDRERGRSQQCKRQERVEDARFQPGKQRPRGLRVVGVGQPFSEIGSSKDDPRTGGQEGQTEQPWPQGFPAVGQASEADQGTSEKRPLWPRYAEESGRQRRAPRRWRNQCPRAEGHERCKQGGFEPGRRPVVEWVQKRSGGAGGRCGHAALRCAERESVHQHQTKRRESDAERSRPGGQLGPGHPAQDEDPQPQGRGETLDRLAPVPHGPVSAGDVVGVAKRDECVIADLLPMVAGQHDEKKRREPEQDLLGDAVQLRGALRGFVQAAASYEEN